MNTLIWWKRNPFTSFLSLYVFLVSSPYNGQCYALETSTESGSYNGNVQPILCKSVNCFLKYIQNDGWENTFWNEHEIRH